MSAQNLAASPVPLLLPPAADRSRRQWLVRSQQKESQSAFPRLEPSTVAFGSLAALWPCLGPEFRRLRRAEFERLDGYIHASCTTTGSAAAGPALALRRRISRESGPATRAVELGARLLLDGLSTAGARVVHVSHVDELDSLTLRVLARAALAMTDAHQLTIVFHSTADPRSPIHGGSLAETSRASLLTNVAMYGQFQFNGNVGGPLPPRTRSESSLAQAASDLVAHNYEAALLASELGAIPEEDTWDALRISALAAVNWGQLDLAESLLVQAIDRARDPGRRAHLYCLRALIASKRRGDLVSSERFIEKGLQELSSGASHITDADVEHAWLLNARALNRALSYRATGDVRFFREAYTLEVDASRLVANGCSEEKTYLRYNLLANLAFLWESKGEPIKAARVFERVFRDRETDDPVAKATLGYRLGVLYAKSGDLQGAERVLEGLDLELPEEEWSAIEHLLRARSQIALADARFDDAEEFARRGYNIALAVRSARAAEIHGCALAEALRRAGRRSQAGEALASLKSLGLRDNTPLSVAALRPKLPAYIPEIDLEDIPGSDTNSRLSGP